MRSFTEMGSLGGETDFREGVIKSFMGWGKWGEVGERVKNFLHKKKV